MWWGHNGNFQLSDSARKALLLLIGLIIIALIFRFNGWLIFFIFFPFVFRFSRSWFDLDQNAVEKRKREPETILIMPDDKPKRAEPVPRYALGDDGELIELDDRSADAPNAERNRRDQDDDAAPRRAYSRDEYV